MSGAIGTDSMAAAVPLLSCSANKVLLVFPTASVSETIRKPPIAEDQSALEKNMWEPRHLSHCRNSVKSCLPTQNFAQIRQLVAELWPKMTFKMAAVRHLEF